MSRFPSFIYLFPRSMATRFRLAVTNSFGITLMETIIALAMFSSAGTAVLLGVGAAHTSSDRVTASAIAENLARNQMEYVSSLDFLTSPYPKTYASIADDTDINLSIPTGYVVTAKAQTYVASDGFTGSIQKVVVTVTRDGTSILVLESLRSGP